MVTVTVLPPLEYTVVDGHVVAGVVTEKVQRPVHQPLELVVVVDAGVGD
jgi:hypothetical protein